MSVVDSEGKCIPVQTKLEYCMEYKTPTECSRCFDNYGLNAGKCAKISITNCVALKTYETCRSCAKGLLPSADEKSCTENLCSISKCELCFMDGTKPLCQRCYPGYTRKSDKTSCVINNENTKNCYTLGIDGLCEECMDGFYMSDKKCLVSTAYTFQGFEIFASTHLLPLYFLMSLFSLIL
jgi:hypothetical protein